MKGEIMNKPNDRYNAERIEASIWKYKNDYRVISRLGCSNIYKKFDTLKQAQEFKAEIMERRKERRIKFGTTVRNKQKLDGSLPVGMNDHKTRIGLVMTINNKRITKTCSYGRKTGITREQAIQTLTEYRQNYIREHG